MTSFYFKKKEPEKRKGRVTSSAFSEDETQFPTTKKGYDYVIIV